MEKRIFFILISVVIGFSINIFSYDYTENNRWKHSTIPVHYEINTSGAPAGAANEIISAFNTWKNAANNWITFIYDGSSSRGYSNDGYNVLSWGYAYGAIAASANYDYYPI